MSAVIASHVMPGMRAWFEQRVPPLPAFGPHEGPDVVWWLPDGRLLSERPALPPCGGDHRGRWTAGGNWLPSRQIGEAVHNVCAECRDWYFAMPMRAAFIEHPGESA